MTILGDLESGDQGGKKRGGVLFSTEDGGDALVPRDTSLLCSSSPPRPGLGCALRPLRKSDAVSFLGVLQSPRPKVYSVLEVLFVLAAVWFNLCSLRLPLPLLTTLSGALLGFELEGCVRLSAWLWAWGCMLSSLYICEMCISAAHKCSLTLFWLLV